MYVYLFKLKVGGDLLAYRHDMYRHPEKYCEAPIYMLAKNLVYRLVGVPGSVENRSLLLFFVVLISASVFLTPSLTRETKVGGQCGNCLVNIG